MSADLARRLFGNVTARLSGAVIAFAAAVALLAPVLAPAGPFRTSSRRLAAPSLAAPLGTDDLGRNIAVGLAYGARTSLLVALGVALLAGLIAVLVGSVSGYIGALVDDLLMRLTELFMVLPRFFLAIATAALFGARVLPLILLLGLISWPGPARVLRAQVLTQRELPYVQSARALGAGRMRILFRHVLPNSLGPFVVSVTFLSGAAILIEAGLAFLGLGDAATPSWGTMLRDAQPIMRYAPWAVAAPALAVSATVLSINLFGDGLLEALAPGSAEGSRPEHPRPSVPLSESAPLRRL